ncbi:SulP family inorganic anion transporter [Rhodococcus sp. PAM 2766]|uniref:SulP family inorganic anion transporter n=1 Tax=Rhodococcus parequi TaxID=3137122 RepID=A0ABW9FI96_9NOCA
MARVVGVLGRWARSRLPERRTFKNDLIAGIPGAISSVPDGMASGVLAGVNPVHGLYASFAGPLFGGLQTSTKLMVITTTSAAALAAGSAVADVPEAARSGAIVLLTLIAGLIMVAAALLRLGRYTRFVSHSVMTGFLTGIAVTKFFDVVSNPSGIDWRALVTGVTALLVLVILARTRLALFGSLLALVVPSAVVIGFGWDSVARVSDVGTIPTGLPMPLLPDPGLFSFELLGGALAVAVIVLVQGAGVAESAPNRGGGRSDADVDFSAQGVGNVGAALFGGMPVGGSVGQTALNVSSGARGRWGAVWSGIWMLVILVVFAGVVGKVPMPTLAAVLVVAAVGSIRPREIGVILRTGPTSQIAIVTTFVATLLLPVAAAVGIGVALSLLLQLNREAMDLSVVELVPGDDGTLREQPAPKTLADGQVVVLDVYGSLFYAGARTLQARLPDPAGAVSPEVILRLRGRTTFGATFFSVVRDYTQRLEAAGGRLYLSGIDRAVSDDWDEDRLAGQGLALEVFPATDTIGESTRRAFDAAERRIVRVTARAEG